MMHHNDTQSGMLRPIRCDCGRVHHVTMEFVIQQCVVQCECGVVLRSSGVGEDEKGTVGWFLIVSPKDVARSAVMAYLDRRYPDMQN